MSELTPGCEHRPAPDYSDSTETHQAIPYPKSDDPEFERKEFDFWTQSFTVEQRRSCRESIADREAWTTSFLVTAGSSDSYDEPNWDSPLWDEIARSEPRRLPFEGFAWPYGQLPYNDEATGYETVKGPKRGLSRWCSNCREFIPKTCFTDART